MYCIYLSYCLYLLYYLIQLSSPDSHDLSNGECEAPDLCDKDGCHSLIQSCAVHVDSGSNGDDKASHSHINLILLLKTLEGHWQGS